MQLNDEYDPRYAEWRLSFLAPHHALSPQSTVGWPVMAYCECLPFIVAKWPFKEWFLVPQDHQNVVISGKKSCLLERHSQNWRGQDIAAFVTPHTGKQQHTQPMQNSAFHFVWAPWKISHKPERPSLLGKIGHKFMPNNVNLSPVTIRF